MQVRLLIAERKNLRLLTLLDAEVLGRNHLHVLVLDGVPECLELLGRASIVFEHDKEGFGARKRPLACSHLAVGVRTRYVAIIAPGSILGSFLGEEPVVDLLDCTDAMNLGQ